MENDEYFIHENASGLLAHPKVAKTEPLGGKWKLEDITFSFHGGVILSLAFCS